MAEFRRFDEDREYLYGIEGDYTNDLEAFAS